MLEYGIKLALTLPQITQTLLIFFHHLLSEGRYFNTIYPVYQSIRFFKLFLYQIFI